METIIILTTASNGNHAKRHEKENSFWTPTLVGLCPIKSVLSVCPSVRDTLFSELTQVFSDLLHEVGGP